MDRFRVMRLLGVLALTVSGCAAVTNPGADPETCHGYCNSERQDCYGALARIFRECLSRNPNSQLESESCYRQRSTEAISLLDIQHPGPPAASCEKRFELCQQDCG